MTTEQDTALAALDTAYAATTQGEWEAISDSRPDVQEKRLAEAWDEAPMEVRRWWRDVVTPILEAQIRTSDGGFMGGGQVARAVHKYPGHVIEFAKYWIANEDADWIAAVHNQWPTIRDALTRARAGEAARVAELEAAVRDGISGLLWSTGAWRPEGTPETELVGARIRLRELVDRLEAALETPAPTTPGSDGGE